jgi:hypothetical protein
MFGNNKKLVSSVAVDAAQEKRSIPSETFKADGKVYKFVVHDFQWEGNVVKASAALKNAELLAELVIIKAGVIALVGEGGE